MKILLGIILLAVAVAPEHSPVAPGAQLEKVSGDFTFSEGPTTDADGNVYFTDQPNDRIMKWSVDGKLTTFLQPCGRSNGLCFDPQGRLWACADDKNELWRIDVATKKIEVVLKDRDGKLFNGPNDVWYSSDGVTWQKTDQDPAWTGREDVGVVVFKDKIWMIAGMDKNWKW